MKGYLSKLQPNARICISFFPFWAIPYTFYLFYLSLYLKESGITDIQIGNIMVVANAAALASSVIAAPVVDRLGRKWATLLFDLVSSALPALLFLLWPRYTVALLAMALTGLNRIMSIGYYLLMIEDGPEENSVVAMNLFNIIQVAAGLLTPLAGILILRRGIIDGERIFLLIATISMTGQAIARHTLLKETPTGRSIQQRMQGQRLLARPSRYLLVYRTLLSSLAGNRATQSAMAINALIYVYFSLGTTASLLFTPFFIDFSRLSPSQVSLVGGVYSLGTLTAMVVVNPHLKRSNLHAFSIAATLLSLFGFALLLLLPTGRLLSPLISVSLISLSYGVLKTCADALLAVESSGEARSAIYAASSLVSSILGILFIKVTSMLYARHAGTLIIMCALLLSVVLTLAAAAHGGRNHGTL